MLCKSSTKNQKYDWNTRQFYAQGRSIKYLFPTLEKILLFFRIITQITVSAAGEVFQIWPQFSERNDAKFDPK